MNGRDAGACQQEALISAIEHGLGRARFSPRDECREAELLWSVAAAAYDSGLKAIAKPREKNSHLLVVMATLGCAIGLLLGYLTWGLR